MKFFHLLIAACYLLCSSCGTKDSSLMKYRAESLVVEVTPIPLVDGIAFSPRFTATATHLDYMLSMNITDMTWDVSGNYSLRYEYIFPEIPNMESEFNEVSKSGTFTKIEENIYFDQSLFHIEMNGLNWLNMDGSEIKYQLIESDDLLIQEQNINDIKVDDNLNGNVKIKTIWKKN